jgi:TerC family integral membrane protein
MWLWAAFILFVFSLVALDLGIFHRNTRTIAFREALILSGAWIGVALAFNVFIFVVYEHHWFGLDLAGAEPDGRMAAILFLTGYLIEKSLGLDNIFFIAMIFSYFRVPTMNQHRVLYWGIVGAVIMRGVMILAGTALIERVDWILYLFGALLIISGVRMGLVAHPPDLEKNPIITWTRQFVRWRAIFRAARKAIIANAACAGIDHDRDLRSDFCPGFYPRDFFRHARSVPGVHEQYYGAARAALAVLRTGRARRSVSLSQNLPWAASGADRDQAAVERCSR